MFYFLHGFGVGQIDEGGLVGLDGDEAAFLQSHIAQDDLRPFFQVQVVHHL